MKILTKLMLASAVMVTSGFADPDVGTTVLEGANSAELNGKFGDTNYIAKDGGAINVVGDTTVPAGQSITIESKGVGTVAENVVLSNEGVAAMHWNDDPDLQGLVAGSGKIDQIIVEGGPATVEADFDGEGTATWYVYECYDRSLMQNSPFYHKTNGNQKYFPSDYTGWYCEACAYFGQMAEWMVGSFDTGTFKQLKTESKSGSIVINNVEKLEYIAAGSAVLDADTTDLTGTDLDGKDPKLVAVSANFAFDPPIPSTIADVTLNGGTDLLESPATGTITNDTSLGNYFSGFGVSFKKADKITDSNMKYVAARSVIDAIASGTVAEAVLLNQTTAISVDATVQAGNSIAIAANLHSIGNSAGVKFSGTKGLDLSGNNELLEKMTADCPVKISGTSSMPGNSTFNNGLTIAEDVTTPEGETTVTGDFKVESGKTFTVKGKLIVGNAV